MKVKTYDFIIGYENKVRELESVCLLKYELERRGHSVMIFQEFDQRYDDIKEVIYHARVLVLSCAYADRYVEKFIRNFISFDKLINLQWEQVYNKQLENDPDSIINIHGDICRQAVHIAWGDFNIDRLTNLMGLPPQNIMKTGLISMDLLKPEFNGLYKTRAEVLNEYGIDPKYKVAILLGVFSRAFLSQKQLDDLEADVGFSYHEIARQNRKRFDIEMDWIAKLLREHDDVFFIYRPHPGDEYDRCPKDVQDKLDSMMAETGRFIVNQDYSVRQWFKVVDKVYTGFSTTMVDSYFAGVGCYLLSPAGIPIVEGVRLFDNATPTETYEDFESAMYSDNGNVSPLSLELIDGYYTLDTSLCYPRVADAFERVLTSPEYTIDTTKLRQKITHDRDTSLAGKSLAKRLKLRLWKYDWFYSLYWAIMQLPVKHPYFVRQQEYKARINQYYKNYVGSKDEIKIIEDRIKKCLR